MGLENEKPMTDGASEAAKPDNKETLQRSAFADLPAKV